MTPMMQSIRWRLVASYVLSSVATVGIAGVLAQSLVGRAVAERRAEDLTANAVAIAGRLGLPSGDLALPHPPVLFELTRSAAFVADARVRVLDAEQNVVADSGEPEEAMEMVVLAEAAAAAPWSGERPSDAALVVRRYDGGFGPHRLTLGVSGVKESAFAGLADGPDGLHSPVTEHVFGAAERLDTSGRGPVLVWRTREVTMTRAEGSTDILVTHDAARESRQTLRAAKPPAAWASTSAIRVPIGNPSAPAGFVEVSASDHATKQALATTRRAFSLAALAASLVATALGLVVGRSMTRPLHNLTETAKRMAGDDLTARAEVRSGDEIGQLAAQFNSMADRLGESFQALAEERDALQRFIADASHELRTPITALRSFVELLDGPAAGDDAARAEFLGESHAQLARLEWLTGQLLHLSRLDAGLGGIEKEPVPVADLIQSVLGPLRPRAAARGVDLQAEAIADSLVVHGDRSRLETALANLVENAVKFAPGGGRGASTVRIGADGGAVGDRPAVIFWVEDNGPGIATEDLPHVFERFYRGKPLADDPGGSGLGLAIVRSIARAHGGGIAVESTPGAGSRFTLTLPA